LVSFAPIRPHLNPNNNVEDGREDKAPKDEWVLYFGESGEDSGNAADDVCHNDEAGKVARGLVFLIRDDLR